MNAFYNENDRFAADWLENLIAGGMLPAGRVERRSIADLGAEDISGYTQAHFFAGIGGWPLALRLAGWPEDEPVWTGSCPCQPFSQAGRRRGFADERHLWPVWRPLIEKFRPPTVFGEQVASEDGRLWFHGVRADLEAMGYAVGGADLCAAGVGANHIRQRLYWVAHAGRERWGALLRTRGEGRWEEVELNGCGDAGGMGYTNIRGREGKGVSEKRKNKTGESLSPWSGKNCFVPCSDGKTRRIEPGTSPLAHGVPGRVGLLRGYGNAIVPPLASEFVKAVMDAIGLNSVGGER